MIDMNHSVIVIDDEQDFLDSMKRCLLMAGIKNIRIDSDPRQALEAIDAGEVFDLALIDFNMPGLNGKQVLEAIKKKTPRTVCLMVTAVADVKFAIDCMKLGAADYIQKPFTPEEFLAIINPLLMSMKPGIPEKLKLLVVEDNKVTLKQYASKISNTIFEVKYAEDGELASKRYHEWKPDIILLDLMLPYKSGFSLLKEIRAEDSSTAIIVISSLDAKEDILSCAALGIQGYMVKPVKLSTLNLKILEYYGKISAEHAKTAETFRERLQERGLDVTLQTHDPTHSVTDSA
jgi:DNA-binding response OmpR family regulator